MNGYTFSFDIPAKTLQILVATLKELETEYVNINFKDDGIHISTLDAAHISLIECHIRAQDLPRYYCGDKTVLGFKVEELYITLGHAKSDYHLTLGKPVNTNALEIITKHTGSLTRTSTTLVGLMNVEEETLETEIQTVAGELTFDSQDFKKIVSELFSMGDKVDITMEPPDNVCFRLSGSGSQRGHEIVLHPDASEKLEIRLFESVAAEFALSYISKFCKAADFRSAMKLHLITSQAGPLAMFEFYFEQGYIRFYLAPQMNND